MTKCSKIRLPVSVLKTNGPLVILYTCTYVLQIKDNLIKSAGFETQVCCWHYLFRYKMFTGAKIGFKSAGFIKRTCCIEKSFKRLKALNHPYR